MYGSVTRNTDQRGFSLTELLIVVGVAILLAATGLPMMEAALTQGEADTALNVVMSKMRLARQLSVDLRRVHRVTALQPNRVRLERRDLEGSWDLVVEELLPGGFEFRIEPGLPSEESLTPDRMGADSAIDFKNSNQILFRPEGSATDDAREPANGVAYLAYPGKLETARAVTVFGSTGRIRGWRFARDADSSWRWME